jgi:CubicO group peptidase (beta-lactamase class C family)
LIFAAAMVLAVTHTPSVGQPAIAAGVASASDALFSSILGETRALLVMQNGKIVHERYRHGYTDATRLISWSMAKTVTAIAIGMLVDEGKLHLDAPAPIAAWRQAGDERSNITLRHLLNMTSGLQHQEGSEDGKPIQDADTVRLLFTDGAESTADYATSRPLAHAPGSHWQYSTATSHILADIAANLMTTEADTQKRRVAIAAWFSRHLWTPLEITSAEWDFDSRGLFLGGSMLHMTTRDYGRLGQLLLDHGKAPDGKQLLSTKWLDVMTAKAPVPNNSQYGGQLWLNLPPLPGKSPALFHPRGTSDTFAMIGHLGQYVVVIPSKRAVVVRLGKSVHKERGHVRTALADLIDALPTPR